MIVGLVNNVRTCAHDATRGGGNGDLIAAGIALIALAALGMAVYRALEGVFGGVADTAGDANLIVAWLVGGAVALAVLAVAGWFLGNRWADRRAGLVSTRADVDAFRAHCLEVADARAALEATRRAALEAAERQPRQRATATRLDRATDTGWNREPVNLNRLDAPGGEQ